MSGKSDEKQRRAAWGKKAARSIGRAQQEAARATQSKGRKSGAQHGAKSGARHGDSRTNARHGSEKAARGIIFLDF